MQFLRELIDLSLGRHLVIVVYHSKVYVSDCNAALFATVIALAICARVHREFTI